MPTSSNGRSIRGQMTFEPWWGLDSVSQCWCFFCFFLSKSYFLCLMYRNVHLFWFCPRCQLSLCSDRSAEVFYHVDLLQQSRVSSKHVGQTRVLWRRTCSHISCHRLRRLNMSWSLSCCNIWVKRLTPLKHMKPQSCVRSGLCVKLFVGTSFTISVPECSGQWRNAGVSSSVKQQTLD